MKKQLTLGSLFDGIGGFPLAGQKSGMRPVWASEIEPFPIRVTEERFPDMRHYGDIHKLNGGELEPVDVISSGSPCQDLSLAGRLVGLETEYIVRRLTPGECCRLQGYPDGWCENLAN